MIDGYDGVERTECRAAREQLLEADVDALVGVGDSPLALHVRGCEPCRTLAGRVIADQQALDRALTELSAKRAAVAVSPSVHARTDSWVIRRRAVLRRAVPFAAAAVLAALLLLPQALRRESLVVPGDTLGNGAVVVVDPSRDVPGEGRTPSLQVEAPAEGRMAVFETRDPSITVVWFY